MSVTTLTAPSPQHFGSALTVWSLSDLARAVTGAGIPFPSADSLDANALAPAAAEGVRRLWAIGNLGGMRRVAVLLGIKSGIVTADLTPDRVRIHLVSCQPTDGIALKPSILGPEAEDKLMRSLASLGVTWGVGLLKTPGVSWAARSMRELLGPISWYRLRVAQM